jgi:sigma-B regulation protein RsbU (phosphoserine phosphatase)
MATIDNTYLQTAREQLEARLDRLESLLQDQPTEQVTQLITEVDKAIERIDTGHFGECTVCHDSVEAERLMHDPLVSVCLGCLSPAQQRALEYDLELAARIQSGLLPSSNVAIPGWSVAFHYQPAGVIGGDYFDVIGDGRGGAYFLVADVAGKGVSAAMLSANLRAMFRALVPLGLEVEKLLTHANRLFCESKLPMQYATLVFGHSNAAGELKLVNAGHLPILLASGNKVTRLESNCMPLGLFAEQEFPVKTVRLQMGDTLVLYTDGVTEAQDGDGMEYGIAKLQAQFEECITDHPQELVKCFRERLQGHRGATERVDDETLLALQYIGPNATGMVS